MVTKIAIACILCTLLFSGCNSHSLELSAVQGKSREQVVREFGEPDSEGRVGPAVPDSRTSSQDAIEAWRRSTPHSFVIYGNTRIYFDYYGKAIAVEPLE